MSILSNAKEIADLVQDVGNMELYRKMVNLEREIVELQGENIELIKKVRGLEERLRSGAELEFRKPLYYAEGDDQPFCPRCWEVDEVRVHLDGPVKKANGTVYNCLECKKEVYTERWSPRQPQVNQGKPFI